MSSAYVIVIALALIQGAICEQSGEVLGPNATVSIAESNLNATEVNDTDDSDSMATPNQNESTTEIPTTTDGEVVERVSYIAVQEDSTESTSTTVVPTTPNAASCLSKVFALVFPIVLGLIPASRLF